MQSKAQYPVWEEVTQDALSGWRAGLKMWQQGEDGVLRCVHEAVFGIRLQLHVGAARFPSMQEWLIEEEEVSTYPEGHRRGRGNESGENLRSPARRIAVINIHHNKTLTRIQKEVVVIFLTCTCMHRLPNMRRTVEWTTYTKTLGLKNPGVGFSSPVPQSPSFKHSSGLAWKYAYAAIMASVAMGMARMKFGICFSSK